MADYNPGKSYRIRMFGNSGFTWADLMTWAAYGSGWSANDFVDETGDVGCSVQLRGDGNTNKYDTLWRSLLRFDTVVPADTYTSGTLTVTVNTNVATTLAGSSNTVVLVGFDGTAFNTGDLDSFLATKLSDDVSFAGKVSEDTLTFTLNAAGLAYINASPTDFCLGLCLSDEQPAPSEPTWGNGHKSSVDIVGVSHSSKDPPVLSLSTGGGGGGGSSRRHGGAIVGEPNYLTLAAMLRS